MNTFGVLEPSADWFRNYMRAVIDNPPNDKISRSIDAARNDQDASILSGGECHDRERYFIRPTHDQTKNPGQRLLCEQIFRPRAQCPARLDVGVKTQHRAKHENRRSRHKRSAQGGLRLERETGKGDREKRTGGKRG